jgi:TRAP-type mannitol/chloroaromatic compound transport system permease small subunit
LLILAEIAVAFLSRFVPGVPSGIEFAWEYSAYLMGVSFLLGSALALRAGSHVRVELLLRAGHGRHARLFEILSSALGAAFCCFLAWTMVSFALQSFTSGQVSGDTFTPLWIPQAALALGAIVLAVQMVARLLASLFGLPVDDPSLGAATILE